MWVPAPMGHRRCTEPSPQAPELAAWLLAVPSCREELGGRPAASAPALVSPWDAARQNLGQARLAGSCCCRAWHSTTSPSSPPRVAPAAKVPFPGHTHPGCTTAQCTPPSRSLSSAADEPSCISLWTPPLQLLKFKCEIQRARQPGSQAAHWSASPLAALAIMGSNQQAESWACCQQPAASRQQPAMEPCSWRHRRCALTSPSPGARWGEPAAAAPAPTCPATGQQ